MSHVLSRSEERITTTIIRTPQLRDNQIEAANKVLHEFCSTNIRYGLLRANEQVGKTGTYHYLIRRMFEKKLVDNVYILCGSQELELLNQCAKDVDEWHTGKGYRNNIHIVFRQNFNRTVMNTKRALIVIDESHLVEGIDQTLNKFLNKHKLSMAGSVPSMVETNTYMLSVDATPYAEESAIEYGLSGSKFKVTLEDGIGYFGVKQYYEAGLIQPTFNLAEPRGKYNFMMLLEKCAGKYALVRIQSINKQKAWLIKWATEAGCDIVHFTSEFDKANTQICVTKAEADKHYANYNNRIPSLEEAPKKTTIVIVDGRLRCGKRVPKKHIGFIWEATKVAKTDIIRQSLLGRMCGYVGVKDVYNVPLVDKPLIFIPERILKKPEKNKIIELSDLERTIYPSNNKTIIGPRFANNIIPGWVQTKAMKGGFELTQCVPIRFNLNAMQTYTLPTKTELQIKTECLNKLKNNLELITDNANLTDEQKEEILNWLEGNTAKSCHIRQYKDESNQNMHKCQVEGYLNHTAAKEGVSDFHFLTFCVVFPGFKPLESVIAKPGEVYAIFYTRAPGYVHNIHIESRVSKVNSNTHFTIQATDELLDCVAGTVYGFNSKIKSDSHELHLQFDHFIKCAKPNIGVFGRKFTTLGDGTFISLPRSIYGSNLETLKAIFSVLEADHGIKISYEVKKRRIPAESCSDIELKYISWE